MLKFLINCFIFISYLIFVFATCLYYLYFFSSVTSFKSVLFFKLEKDGQIQNKLLNQPSCMTL
jgi:hypothetical protein